MYNTICILQWLKQREWNVQSIYTRCNVPIKQMCWLNFNPEKKRKLSHYNIKMTSSCSVHLVWTDPLPVHIDIFQGNQKRLTLSHTDWQIIDWDWWFSSSVISTSSSPTSGKVFEALKCSWCVFPVKCPLVSQRAHKEISHYF